MKGSREGRRDDSDGRMLGVWKDKRKKGMNG